MTDGAFAAHDRGIVTACSVVAAGPDLERAAKGLRARPRLEPGLHFVLAGGPLVSRAVDVPTLAPGGRPMRGYPATVSRYILGRIDPHEVERELRAQLERLWGAGIRPTHLNGHQHLHVLPGVIDIVARVAREHSIGYVRVPEDRLLAMSHRIPAIWILAVLARRARRVLRRSGIATNDRAAGIVHAGRLTVERIRTALRSADEITELVAHPGSGDPEIARAHPWGYRWERERNALCDASLRDHLTRRYELVRPSEAAAS